MTNPHHTLIHNSGDTFTFTQDLSDPIRSIIVEFKEAGNKEDTFRWVSVSSWADHQIRTHWHKSDVGYFKPFPERAVKFPVGERIPLRPEDARDVYTSLTIVGFRPEILFS